MEERSEHEWLAERFEEHRDHLRAVAYRMLGSAAEADDAVQDAWLRVSRAGTDGVENLGGWLTTVVSRVCLNVLRARTSRREDVAGVHLPDPVLARAGGAAVGRADPGDQAVVADSVGLALLVVLDTLSPAERLAFVLHDLFGLPFDDIAPMVERSPAAARQLASRARRRVQGAAPAAPVADAGRQREVVDAFFAAARDGDFDGLLAVLDPDVVLRADGGDGRPGLTRLVRGAEAVAGQAAQFAIPSAELHPVLVNGAAGVVVAVAGRPLAIMGFTVVGDRIVAIDAVADPARVEPLAAPVLN